MTAPNPRPGTRADDLDLIARVIRHLEAHRLEQPSLADAARFAGLSPFHLQRLFTRLTGVSPKRFVQCLTLEHAKALLSASRDVLAATHETGLSSPGRLHDLFVRLEAMTPGDHARGGAGLDIAWGLHATPFGRCLVATTPRGVCALRFVDEAGARATRDWLRDQWPSARLRRDEAATASACEAAFGAARARDAITVLVRGTPFQVKAWQALLSIPPGEVATYAQLARAAGRPAAARAAGNACATNRVAVLIPCHRVLRETGAVGGYAWGPERKRALLAWEAARAGG